MNRKIFYSLSLGSALLLSAQVFSQEQDTLDYRAGYDLVLKQQWADAQELFNEFRSNWPESGWLDDASFWNCYAAEQQQSEQENNFSCYQDFIAEFPDSSWVADARSKMAVLGSELAALGDPTFFSLITDGWDVEFDFNGGDIDEEEIARTVERAMAEAEREMERVRIQINNLDLPDIPDFPDFPDFPNMPNFSPEALEEMRARVAEAQERAREFSRRRRSSADDELLTIIGALREDERASELLMRRLESSDNPNMRSRLVFLLQDLPGEGITSTLLDVVDNDESEDVRTSAILVLLDRDDEASRDRLLAIANDASYPTSVRAEIIGELDNWESTEALDLLARIVENESDPVLVREAADALSDSGTEDAMVVLFGAYETVEPAELKRVVLREIADMDLPEVFNFLTEVALSDADDEIAATAINGIADREDNFAVAALENIYANTANLQRKRAALEGIGDSETDQAVEVLAGVTAQEQDPQLLAAALRALGDTDQESAIAPIMEVYRNHADASVRNSAARALRRLQRHPAALDAMLEILEDQLNEDSGGNA